MYQEKLIVWDDGTIGSYFFDYKSMFTIFFRTAHYTHVWN